MANTLVTVATGTTALEAYLYKNLLESEGVPVFVADELTGDWMAFGYIDGYVKVQVPSEEVERARAILEQAKRRRRDKHQSSESEQEPDSPALEPGEGPCCS